MKVKKVVYFDRPGSQNTEDVIAAIKERLKEGDLKYVIVASITGETVLTLVRALAGLDTQVICVSGPRAWDCEMRNRSWPYVQGEVRKELEAHQVKIVETALSTLGGDSVDGSMSRYSYRPASWAVIETLVAIGGYGLKTAVEVLLMATDANALPPFIDAIAVGGTTNRGADTAIVARSTYSTKIFSGDADKRLQVREILAMPRHKIWWKHFMGFEEITQGESLG